VKSKTLIQASHKSKLLNFSFHPATSGNRPKEHSLELKGWYCRACNISSTELGPRSTLLQTTPTKEIWILSSTKIQCTTTTTKICASIYFKPQQQQPRYRFPPQNKTFTVHTHKMCRERDRERGTLQQIRCGNCARGFYRIRVSSFSNVHISLLSSLSSKELLGFFLLSSQH
jgi:hypothetical protein